MSDSVDDELSRVLQLEQELQTKACRNNPLRLSELLAPDFTEVGASGRLWDRPAALELLASETDGDETIEVTNLAGRRLADGFILVRWDAAPEGRRARRTSLWRCDSDGWHQVHHQGTVLDD